MRIREATALDQGAPLYAIDNARRLDEMEAAASAAQRNSDAAILEDMARHAAAPAAAALMAAAVKIRRNVT